MTTLPIGKVIREFRELRGLSKGRLERLSHVGGGYLTRVEEGSMIPSLRNIERLAKALKLEPWELVLHAQKLKHNPHMYDDHLSNLPAAPLPSIDAEVA